MDPKSLLPFFEHLLEAFPFPAKQQGTRVVYVVVVVVVVAKAFFREEEEGAGVFFLCCAFVF
jgi:hypothetical protein